MNESAGEKVKGFLCEFQIDPSQLSFFVCCILSDQSLNYKTWSTGNIFLICFLKIFLFAIFVTFQPKAVFEIIIPRNIQNTNDRIS